MKSIRLIGLVMLVAALLAACVPVSTPAATSEVAPAVSTDLTKAAGQVSFPLLVPAAGSLPADLALTGVQVLPSSGMDALVLKYTGGAQHLEVQESQLPAGAVLQPPGNTPSTAVTVRGRPGYQVSSAPDLIALLWEEDGRMISLSGNLPAADLLKIAEGMQTLSQ